MRNYDITQDLKTGNKLTETPVFKQYDEGQMMTITLTDGGQPPDLKDVSVVGFFRLPNGSIEQRACTVGNNKIFVVLGGNLLLHTGYVQAEFKLYKQNAVTTTFEISYRVQDSINRSTGSDGYYSGVAPEDKKYAILVVGGQSNAVGFDESPVSAIFDAHEHPRIKQLGYHGTNNLKIIPLGHCAESFQNMLTHNGGKVVNANSPEFKGSKGIHLPLAKRIINHIPADYELVVIPCAFGGAGFTDDSLHPEGTYNPDTMQCTGAKKWGDNLPFYKAMRDRIEYVLKMNAANYYIGMVWCQGENDYKQPLVHKERFEKMTTAFFKYFNERYPERVKGGVWSADQWFVYDTVKQFRTESAERKITAEQAQNTQQIWDQYKQWSEKTFVALDFGPQSTDWDNYTNHVRGNGSTVGGGHLLFTHFGNDAYERLVAPAVYQIMLKNNLF